MHVPSFCLSWVCPFRWVLTKWNIPSAWWGGTEARLRIAWLVCFSLASSYFLIYGKGKDGLWGSSNSCYICEETCYTHLRTRWLVAIHIMFVWYSYIKPKYWQTTWLEVKIKTTFCGKLYHLLFRSAVLQMETKSSLKQNAVTRLAFSIGS
jgi:hypothetical protein